MRIDDTGPAARSPRSVARRLRRSVGDVAASRRALGRRRHRLRQLPQRLFAAGAQPARRAPLVVLRRQLVLQPELGRRAGIGRRARRPRPAVQRALLLRLPLQGRPRPAARAGRADGHDAAPHQRPRRRRSRRPAPDPVYGDQIQGQSIPGVPREADVFVSYDEVAGAFADGEAFSLRRPSYRIAQSWLRPDRRSRCSCRRASRPASSASGCSKPFPRRRCSASPIRTTPTATAFRAA